MAGKQRHPYVIRCVGLTNTKLEYGATTMKALVAVLAAVLLAGCGGPAAPKTEDATADLRPFIQKLMTAWETLDLSKVAPYYAKDPGLPFYDIMPLKYNGWQDYESGSKKAFSNWKSIKITIGPELKAYQNGNIAWVTFTSSFEIVPKTGAVIKGEGRNTELLEKRGTDWLVIHEHSSTPMQDNPAPPPAKKKKAAARRR